MTKLSDLFQHLNFLIIADCNNAGNSEFVEETSTLLKDHNCKSVLIFDLSTDDVPHLSDSPKFGQEIRNWFIKNYGKSDIHFIVSKTCNFPFYETAAFDFLIPVVQPDWISQCILVNRHIRTALFSPDKRHILNKQQIYVSRQILKTGSPVEYSLYVELIHSLGGSFVEIISTRTTHIIASSPDDISITKVLESGLDVDIKFVYPSWLIHCFKSCQLVSEDLHIIKTNGNKIDNRLANESNAWELVNNLPFTCTGTKFLEGHTFYLSMDISLPKDQYLFILDFIKSLGGTIYHQVNPSDCTTHREKYDCYLGYSRNSKEYTLLKTTLARSERPNMGNLVWLFTMWSLNHFVPLTGDHSVKIIYRPFGPKLFNKRSLQLSYTNYFGAQRFYIQRMVDLLGGISTTQLSKKNTHLISRLPMGKKYLTAVKWGEVRCKIVNHLWLEQCFKRGEILDVDSNPDFKDYKKISEDIRMDLGQMVYEEVLGEKEVGSVGNRLPLEPMLGNAGSSVDGNDVDDTRGTEEEASQKEAREEKSDIVTNSTFDNISQLPRGVLRSGQTNTLSPGSGLDLGLHPQLNKESNGTETVATAGIDNTFLSGSTLASTKESSQMEEKRSNLEVEDLSMDKRDATSQGGKDGKETDDATKEHLGLNVNGENIRNGVSTTNTEEEKRQGEDESGEPEASRVECNLALKANEKEEMPSATIPMALPPLTPPTEVAVQENKSDLEDKDIQHKEMEKVIHGTPHEKVAAPIENKNVSEERAASMESANQNLDNNNPTTTVSERLTDRVAKRKAEKRLFSDIEALNDFERRNPRRRKGVDLLPEEREEIQERRALENEAREILEKCGHFSGGNNKEESKHVRRFKFHMNCICTGCHFDNMPKLDKMLLQMVGINLYDEGYEDIEKKLNCVVAPKKLRTAKFLRSLSFKPLKYAVTPNFFEDLVRKIKDYAAINNGTPLDIEHAVNINDYSIPEVSQDLLERTRLPTQVFERAQISAVNLIHDIPGGFHIISKILEDHGIAKVNSIKAKALGQFSSIVKNEVTDSNSKSYSRGSGGRGSSISEPVKHYKPPSYILITTKPHQAAKFRKTCSENDPDSNGILVVTWDWCVNSIFNLDIDYDDKEHILYKSLQQQ